MSQQSPPFSIDVGSLKSRAKDSSPATIERADQAGEHHGFLSREGKGRGGRRPSPRTGQVHAKVMPEVAEQIAAEAIRRGVTQGILIEESWSFYQAQQGR